MVGNDSANIKSEELLQEQAYFDVAAEQRVKTLEKLDQLPEGAAHTGAATKARLWAQVQKESYGNVDDPIAFGRVDFEGNETLYIGRHAIWDDELELLVVNWKVPAVGSFYTASPADPQGLERKRQFATEQNWIRDFTDTHFRDIAEQLRRVSEESDAVEEIPRVEIPEHDDALLRELQRNRTGRMADIVATIQAAQFDLIASDSKGLLVIQGGPGTGKTVVALHRVSWLLYNQELLNPDDVLVVGPNRTFMSYIRNVLPDLGDKGIAQRSIKSLYARPGGLRMEREESIEQSRLKGDLQMQNLIDADLAARIRIPNQEDLEVKLGGRTTTFEREEVKRQIDQLRDQKYLDGRMVFRERLHDLALQAHQSSGGLAIF
ncbi:uncharacterized protein METZ01_LOCUS233297, partial [marine metagenome]